MKYTISMARVLLITHIFPPAIDGGSKVISKIGEYLQKNGHHVLVITSNCYSSDDFVSAHPSNIASDKDASNIVRLPVITLFHRPFKLLSKYFPNFKTFSKGPIFSSFKFLISSFKFRPDFIIVGPLPTTIVLYARLIRFFCKTLFNFPSKLLINASFHQSDSDFQTPILLNTLKSADYIWTLTDYETNYFHHHLSIPKNKLLNLGNGVDKSFLITSHLPNYSTNNLLYIGSFAAHKNISTLISAFALLPGKYTLSLAGQKTLFYPQIKTQIENLPPSISKRIKLIFSYDNSKLAQLIDNCQLLISPSTQESFGLVLIEAMARSKPVLAANIPASIELIKKSKSGLIFSQKDPHDLKEKILQITQNKTLQKRFSSLGFKYVSNHYTWDKIGASLCKKLGI